MTSPTELQLELGEDSYRALSVSVESDDEWPAELDDHVEFDGNDQYDKSDHGEDNDHFSSEIIASLIQDLGGEE